MAGRMENHYLVRRSLGRLNPSPSLPTVRPRSDAKNRDLGSSVLRTRLQQLQLLFPFRNNFDDEKHVRTSSSLFMLRWIFDPARPAGHHGAPVIFQDVVPATLYQSRSTNIRGPSTPRERSV
jgi:hypothetical protein